MFITILNQVLVLFVLMAVGFVLGKAGVATEKGIKCITDMVLYTVTPCVIVKSFQREFDIKMLKGILISFLAAAGVHLLFILLSLIIRDSSAVRQRVLQFAVIFTNCGFMSLPLQESILGDDGVLYGASFIAVFNLIAWSYGIVLISGEKKYLSPKKLLINPGIIGIAAGLILYIFSIPLPKVILDPIVLLAGLNTPVPMMIIGYHLSKTNISLAIRDRGCVLTVALRLTVFPLLALAALYLCGIRSTLLVAMAIAACAPSAAFTTMFSAKFGQDTSLSVNLVSLSTLLSLITMPLIIMLAQHLAIM